MPRIPADNPKTIDSEYISEINNILKEQKCETRFLKADKDSLAIGFSYGEHPDITYIYYAFATKSYLKSDHKNSCTTKASEEWIETLNLKLINDYNKLLQAGVIQQLITSITDKK